MSGNLELVVTVDGRRPLSEGWTRALLSDRIAQIKRGQKLFAFRRVRLITENPFAVPHPFRTGLVLLLSAPFHSEFTTVDGKTSRPVTPALLLSAAIRRMRRRRLQHAARQQIFDWLIDQSARSGGFDPPDGPPIYLRTNLWFGAKVGGSFSHTSGIINALSAEFGGVEFVTTDEVPCLSEDVVPKEIDLARVEGWADGAALHFVAQRGLFAEAVRLTGESNRPAFVYQRASLGDVSGLMLARHLRRPFVLEYNGPETWVARHWGEGIPYAESFERIETELLQRADLVVAVSQPLVEDAVNRGAAPDRVLLCPNATDPERFHPDLDGESTRSCLGVSGRKTALLMSSFGPWHGVEVAIEAYALMLQRAPHLRACTSLILAGSGERESQARQLSGNLGIQPPNVVFTSMVPYEQAPKMLAAGDVLLSPQIRNPDGTRFFGSPTKIFEYLAMGRTIIASDLDQIGEVINHEVNGLLVPPSDIGALAEALRRVFDDPAAHTELGRRARMDAVAIHSWRERVQRISNRLVQIGAAPR